MVISDMLIESLLHEEEGTEIEYKSEQYKFTKQHADVKCELLKDILAFTNAWRRSDAFIFIGVKDHKAGMREVLGIKEEFDDATIQQFVNSKTHRPVNFLYQNYCFKGNTIGIIQIPKQKRPSYLKSNYGKLLAAVVYVRRGSSTAIATPEEIADMGKDEVQSHISESKFKLEYRVASELKCQLIVPAYRQIDKVEVTKKLDDLIIPEADCQIVEKNDERLKKIEKEYSDRSVRRPYSYKCIREHNADVLRLKEILQNDYHEFCGLNNLYERAFEFSARSDRHSYSSLHQKDILLTLTNDGTSPVEGVIIYLHSNDRVKFLELSELAKRSISINASLPSDVVETIRIARELETGRYVAATRMELPALGFGSSISGARGMLRPLLGKEPIETFVQDDKLCIKVNAELFHNHSIDIRSPGCYCCPMLADGESIDITYSIHARNLPEPISGHLKIIGCTGETDYTLTV